MGHSQRIQRIFDYALNTRKAPPELTVNRDMQYAAVNIFADRQLWERAPLALAWAIKRVPVVITPDDRIIGRVCHLATAPGEYEDAELKDYMVQAPGCEYANAIYPRYTELAENYLVTVPVRGHISWDWRPILELGTDGVKQKYENALKTAKDEEARRFYAGGLIMLEAMEDWNGLHVKRLEEMGLREAAEVCRKVPRRPAETFYEAVQSFFMQYIVVFLENPFGGNGPGQFDKYMWPYLKRDLEAGVCTLDDARELIDELFIRMDERVSSNDFWNEMIIAGGTHQDGSSAESPLSGIMVESMIGLNITHPTLYMRVAKTASPEYIDLCARYIKHGDNRAQIYYDPHVARAMVEVGRVSQEDSLEYGVGGCLEVGVQGMNSDFLQSSWVNMPFMLELCVTGGVSLVSGRRLDTAGIELKGLGGHGTFESFYAEYMRFVTRLFELSFAAVDRYSEHDGLYRPAYLISGMIGDCFEKGRHMHAGGARYHDYSMTPLGLANVGDSLYAIKKAVFDDAICSADTLLKALKSDFAGYGELQYRLKRIPKYGQEHDGADGMAVRFVTDLAKLYVSFETRFGGAFRPMIITFIYAPLAAEQLGAAPDGSNAHFFVAQGITPQSQAMTKGITAAMNSCVKMPFHMFAGGAASMWDLDPEWASQELIASLHHTFLKNGAQVFQGNVTDVNDLIRAQENPGEYEHLIVRVGGFSARFVGLSKELQDNVIQRRRHRG